MKKEIIINNAKSVEEAVAQGAAMLGVSADALEYEILEEPKKGLFGIGSAMAKVKIIYEMSTEETALSFVETLIRDMGLDAQAKISKTDEGNTLIDISGDSAGVLIGHHGDTLDALQYLVNLAAIRGEGSGYQKIAVDVENYRAKRQETLKGLAHRMADKVLKYKKSVTLEPMNPYERRIIHSEVQHIEGVSTNSIGTDSNRRVVIFLTDQPPQFTKEDGDVAPRKPRGRNDRGDRRDRTADRAPRPPRPQGKSEAAIRAENGEPTISKYTYVHAPTPRPEKLKSVASYFGDEEQEVTSTVPETAEETSEIAKICGIYEDATDEQE